jgi:molybdopterin converting factor small subunit
MVEVRLFATLATFLPAGGRGGATRLEVPEGTTPRALTQRLGIPTELERVTLVNGLDADPDQPLRSEDIVTVFPPLAGGG